MAKNSVGNRVSFSSAIFTAGSKENHDAFLALAQLLERVGFKVRVKVRRESTLRVYPAQLLKYPLLNPRFISGRLEVTILSNGVWAALRLKLRAMRTVAGCTLSAGGMTADGYYCHGVIAIALNPAEGLEAIEPQLRMLHGLLRDEMPDAALKKNPRDVESAIDVGWVGHDDEWPRDPIFEGGRRAVLVNRYERDRSARKRCIGHYGPRCVVCGFSTPHVYGKISRDVIEVHHLRPLSEIGEKYVVDPVRDLRPLCPNCHAAIHSRTPAFTIDELRALIRVRE